MLCHRIRYTEGRLLGFSYDFGVTRNSSSNADAMVLASACLRGIHPPDIIQNGERPGGECLLNAHWLGPWRQHFDDESQGLKFEFFLSIHMDTGVLKFGIPPDNPVSQIWILN